MGKGFKIFLVFLLSIIAIALTGILVLLIMRSPSTGLVFSLGESYSENLLEEKTIEELKDIKVNTNSVDVIVETGDEEVINVKLYSDHPEEYSITEGRTVNVVLKNKKKWFNLFSKGSRVVITVPESYENKITANGGVGDVKVSSLPNAYLVVDKSVGDVKVETIKKANIKLTTGDIKISNINELDAKLTTGDVKLGKVDGYIKIDTTTGDVKIEKANILENSSIKNNVGDVKIEKINKIYVDAKTSVGSTKIGTIDRRSDVELIISSNVGDVKVG